MGWQKRKWPDSKNSADSWQAFLGHAAYLKSTTQRFQFTVIYACEKMHSVRFECVNFEPELTQKIMM